MPGLKNLAEDRKVSDRQSLGEAEAAFVRGELDLAERLAQVIVDQDQFSGGGAHLLGAIALRRRDASGAIRWFEAAFAAGYVTPTSLNNLGEAYRQQGDLEKAFSSFQKALELDNTNPYPHFNIGLVMRAWGNAREAEHFFRTALQVNPGMARAHLELAELYRTEGHIHESEAEYRCAIELVKALSSRSAASILAQCHIRLASLLRECGQPQHGIISLREAGAVGDDPRAILERAYSEFEMAWDQQAAGHYLTAIKAMPELGIHANPRVEIPRIGFLKQWCEAGNGRYRYLASPKPIFTPPLKTIPTGNEGQFVAGDATSPELFCAEIPGGEIIPGDFAVMAGGFVFIDGVINWTYHYGRRGRAVRHESDDGRLLLDLPGRRRRLNGPCILLGGANDRYQWFCETLARIWILSQCAEYADVPMVVSAGLSPAHLTMLEMAGVPRERLIYQHPDEMISSVLLIVPSLMVIGNWVSPVALQHLRRTLGNSAIKGGRRIFLSRGSFQNRRVGNERDLLPILQQYGFEIIDSRNLDDLELLRRVADADIVIGVDDDLLANMVVAPSGSRLGVIATGNNNRSAVRHICGPLSIDVTYLLGEIDYQSNRSLALCDIHLPVHVLKAYLDQAG